MVTTNVNAATSGPYAGVGAGVSSLKNDELFSDSLENVSKKIFLGYQVNKNFAAEVGYLSFGDVLGVTELTGIEASVIGKVPVTPKFSLYGRFGYWNWSASASVANITVLDLEGSDKFLGLGAEFNPAPHHTFRLEANRYDIEDSSGLGADGTTVNLTYARRF